MDNLAIFRSILCHENKFFTSYVVKDSFNTQSNQHQPLLNRTQNKIYIYIYIYIEN
jgi:hypothetical protein